MLPRLALAHYDSLLARRRLTTGTATGVVLGWGGDALTQLKQLRQQAADDCLQPDGFSKTAAFDARRSLAFTVFGGYISGPVNYVWLPAIVRVVRVLAPGGGARALAAKVALQAGILQPIIFLPSFFSLNAVCRGWSVQTTLDRAREEYWPTLQYIWIFWTPAVTFAFGVLPMHQQAAFFAIVGFAWNACLSAFSNPRTGTAKSPGA